MGQSGYRLYASPHATKWVGEDQGPSPTRREGKSAYAASQPFDERSSVSPDGTS